MLRGFRARARSKFKKELGADDETATLAAIALHPFVLTSKPPKTKEFDAFVRQSSFEFAERIQSVSDADELLALARKTVQSWLREASMKYEKWYQKEFYNALSASLRDDDVGDAMGPSLYWPPLGDLSYLTD
jgi:hypothetical protein